MTDDPPSTLSASPRRGASDSSSAASSRLVSSFELHAGLDVRVLALTQLPAEVLIELQRLHGVWRRGGGAMLLV